MRESREAGAGESIGEMTAPGEMMGMSKTGTAVRCRHCLSKSYRIVSHVAVISPVDSPASLAGNIAPKIFSSVGIFISSEQSHFPYIKTRCRKIISKL